MSIETGAFAAHTQFLSILIVDRTLTSAVK